eukprot:4425959-Amphidinium_carterae.1
MLQRDPPCSPFLAWGWLKLRWLKTPGQPAQKHAQQGTVENQQMSHRLVTTIDPLLSHEVLLHEPFEHKHCDDQQCRFWRAAQCSPDYAPCGRNSGITYTFSRLGDVGGSLQCVPGAVMRKCSQQQRCPLKAWRTGDAGNVYCSTTWQILLTRITILGSTLRCVL